MIKRPECNFCKAKSDIYETKDNKKIYYCGGCYLEKRHKHETNTRPRDQRFSRQR